MAKFVEIVPPPAEVDIDIIETAEDARDHIDVIPDTHGGDETVVGYVLAGLTKERVLVHKGDALIKYADGTLVIKRGEDVSAFYKPLETDFSKLLPSDGDDK